jgi:hypothetical protein
MSILNSTPPSIAVVGQRAKPIKIDFAYAKQLQAMLDKVNGKARTYTFAASGQLLLLAEDAERQLNALGVAKARRKGASAIAVSGGTMPRAYKFSRQLTKVRIERRTAGWYLISAEQISGHRGGSMLILTPAQDAEAVANLRLTYECARPKPADGWPTSKGDEGWQQNRQVA